MNNYITYSHCLAYDLYTCADGLCIVKTNSPKYTCVYTGKEVLEPNGRAGMRE